VSGMYLAKEYADHVCGDSLIITCLGTHSHIRGNFICLGKECEYQMRC
jgi:hypothetical protein